MQMEQLKNIYYNVYSKYMKAFGKLSLCMFSMAIAIVAYSKFRCKFPNFKDPLGKFPFGGEHGKFAAIADGWSQSHFIFFTILGFFFPDQMYAAMVYGLLWELLEWLTQHTNSSVVNMLRGVSTCANNHLDEGEHYIYSKSTDIIMNLTGFLLGSGVKMLIKKL
jgi:hypothetical protein